MLDKPAAQHPVSVIDDGGSSIKLIREGYSKRIKPNKNNACQSCVFKTLTCGAAGPVDSPFVIVGESPGKQEMLYGRPFIGQSGDLLKNCLTQLGFYSHGDLPEPYITNAVKCVPDGRKDQNIMQKACHCCRETLMQEIRAYPRKVILALGASAAWALTGDFKLKITQIRGTVYPSPLASEGIVTAVHPAFLLRGGGSLQKFKADVGQAVDLLTKKPRPRYKDSNHIVLETIDDFYRVAKRLDYTVWWHQALDLGPVAIGTDLETSGFSALENYILSAHFGWEDTINYVVPERIFELDGDTGEPLHPAYLEAVRLFYQYTSDRVRFVWHNGKFDIQFLWALNIAARVDEDTMLLSYTLDENPGLHDLEQVSANAIGAPNWKAMLDKYLPNKNSSYAIIPRPVLYKYGGKDIASTIQSFRVLRAQVQADEKLERAYTMVMLSATKLLAKIESNGIYVDRQQNAENKVILTQEIAKIEAEFNAETIQLCNKTFNLNSPADMANVIYGHLQIEPLKGKGYSTGKDILEALPPHKLIKLLLEHRKAKKQLSTYVVNLLPRQDPKVKKRKILPGHIKKDGRVHPTFLIHGTVTGRLAARKPNTQNPPRVAVIRGQFAAPDGLAVVEVDLNQAELRSLAQLSGDPNLIAVYTDPEHPGLHHETSVAIFGKGYTGEHKMLAKAVNFGIVYGRTGASIAVAHDMPIAEGEEWITRWAGRFPIAWQFIQECRRAPLNGLSLFTCFGRKRRFSVVSRNNANAVQNEASNFPHQSTASDITLVSHCRINEDRRYKGRTINLIHDAGLHEIANDPDLIDEQVALIIHYMEREAELWGLTRVPFKAEAKLGRQWGKLKDYHVKGTYDFGPVDPMMGMVACYPDNPIQLAA